MNPQMQQLITIEGREKYECMLSLATELNSVETISNIQKFLKAYPTFAQAHNDLAVLYYKEGNQLKALAHYEKAYKLDPLNITIRKNLADFYFVELQWAEDAIHIYQDILNNNPFEIETLNALGAISVTLGRREQASQYYTCTLQLDASNVQACQALQQLSEQLGVSKQPHHLPNPSPQTPTPVYEYFVPNQHKIEIEITTFCNLNCLNCGRSCAQAPSDEYMSLKQIERFVQESLELNWTWEYIGLIGGEPTLHPHFFEILTIVHKYKLLNPSCTIEIVTNGYGAKVNDIINRLPDWVCIRNSAKTSKINEFFTINIAPIDLAEYEQADFTAGCHVTQNCGLGLSRYGYYPCGAGASCDRVFGFNIGLKKLSLVTESVLKNQLNLLCRYCGHYKVTNPINSRFNNRVTETVMSKTWQNAYEDYRKSRPVLPLY